MLQPFWSYAPSEILNKTKARTPPLHMTYYLIWLKSSANWNQMIYVNDCKGYASASSLSKAKLFHLWSKMPGRGLSVGLGMAVEPSGNPLQASTNRIVSTRHFGLIDLFTFSGRLLPIQNDTHMTKPL